MRGKAGVCVCAGRFINVSSFVEISTDNGGDVSSDTKARTK